MIENLSDEARLVLQFAEQEARSFRHDYVGTEHILLGLYKEGNGKEGNGVAATVLRSYQVGLGRVRHEIEQLIQVGPIQHEPTTDTKKQLPLTPRAQQVLKFAEQEARMVGHSLVNTEHMLLGLLHEPDGVAGVILRNCGLQLDAIRAEVLKIRHLQMRIVERVVRPLLASNARKRKIRDELLTHLSAIYDEELARHNEPFAAVAAASERFGCPAELTTELQATVPRPERFEAKFEPWFGWRPPETGTQWMFRSAIQMGLMMMALYVLAALLALREFGWSYSVWLTIRPIAAAVIVVPVSVAMSGICHFKMRDHIFGVYGSQKSWGRTFAWATLLAVVTMGCGFTFLAVAYGSFAPADAAFYPCVAAGVIWALCMLVFARIFGPQEIRDAMWALLDLREDRAIAD